MALPDRAGPVLVALASFSSFTLLGGQLTASVAFPALTLFNILRFPVMMFPNQIMNLVNARVALKRVQSFMEVRAFESHLKPHIP